MKIALIKTHFTRLLLFPSFLCLDAPLAALGWAWLLRRENEVAPGPPPEFAALFFAVWSIYLGDRILDTLRSRSSSAVSEDVPLRHEWARGRLHVLIVLAVLAAVGLAWAVIGLEAETLRVGFGAALLTGCYFLFFRFSGFHTRLPRILPGKELLIAACFTAGIALAATGGKPWLEPPLLLAGMGLLFAGNCLLISRVESKRDQREDPAAYYSHSSCRLDRLPEILLVAALAFGGMSGFIRGCGAGELALFLMALGTLILARTRSEGMRPYVPALADGILLVTWLLPGALAFLRGISAGS